MSKDQNKDAARIKNSRALHKAIEEGTLSDMAQVLKNDDVDVNKLIYEHSGLYTTPLHKAVKQRDTTIVKLLIQYDADINITDAFRNTALHKVCLRKDFVKVLLAYGANIHFKNIDNESPLDNLKEEMQEEYLAVDDQYPDLDERDVTYDLYMKAILIDAIFQREDKNIIKEKLNKALKQIKYIQLDDHIDFMALRFKSLCAMLNHGLQIKKDGPKFETYLKQIITEDFLPEKIISILNNLLDDYQSIVENIESFALWDAYNIYAKENGLKTIEAPVNYKQAAILACDPCTKSAASTIDEIVKFCHEHPVYQNHSYLDDEASAPEIAKLMHKHNPCAGQVQELYAKYKNVIFSSTIKDAIDIYQTMELGGEDIISSKIS